MYTVETLFKVLLFKKTLFKVLLVKVLNNIVQFLLQHVVLNKVV